MRIWCLTENTTQREDMQTEHGLSLYIETEEGQKILFDMGQTAAFAENAKTLGIDLEKVDVAIISHGHYDHGGGLLYFLQQNQRAKVYLQKEAFVPHFNGERYIGLSPELENYRERFCWVENDRKIGTGLELRTYHGAEQREPSYGAGLFMEKDGQRQADDFQHEQYLLIQEGQKRVLISGCSHRGILNLLAWERADVIIGGFHLMKLIPQTEDQMELERIADRLRTYPVQYHTCHCTGEEPYRYLKQRLGEQLSYLSAGMFLEI